ncbi:ATP-NAD kinase [Saccharobesus litoralis]|uniref:ATP-NAD kinase n=1 Tax=Saccharobesus litoralis TaxID=2172099 RepID=A0A2S0VVF0_9ALTE|nr:ATP-NAD kinase family protein [Saccharobesus litoralis]AWB68204.1 ATP-NAD kinase [Saccharobesus litoralis]
MVNLRIGLIINPYAGIGGAVALKGSDGEQTRDKALASGAIPQAQNRVLTALQNLTQFSQHLHFITASGDMGESCLQTLGLSYNVAYQVTNHPSLAEDTENAVTAILAQQVDILVFAGGDGTARNIYNQLDESTPVLGIPAGCKIHSGVYTITPKAAGQLLEKMLQGQVISLGEADVMDIDEALFRQGRVNAKRYGEMQIPMDLRYVQAVKSGGKENEELVLDDIAAEIIDQMADNPDTLYLIGSGSTTQAIMQNLGQANTLLGVDAVVDQAVINTDLTANDITQLLSQYDKVKLVITLIGGQGHLFGRGNQQLNAENIKKIGRDNIIVVATKSKISKLNGQPLIVDTNDTHLDQQLAGPIKIITGYHDTVIYPIAEPIR